MKYAPKRSVLGALLHVPSGGRYLTYRPLLSVKESVTNKPPAFQFYAKDWRSSMTVQRMSREQRSIFLDMMAIAWDSDDPGIITLSEDQLCRELRIKKSSLRRFHAMFPSCWERKDGVLIQPKLRDQYIEMQSFIEKKRDAGRKGNAVRWGCESQTDRPASASAIASASAKQTPLVPAENAFQVFWKAYPKKVNEKQAFRAWVQCTGIHDHLEEILTVIMQYETSGMWDDPTKIPNAENFIRDKRWRDEVPKRAGTKNDQRISRTLESVQRVMESGPQMGSSFSGALPRGPIGTGSTDLLRIPRKV